MSFPAEVGVLFNNSIKIVELFPGLMLPLKFNHPDATATSPVLINPKTLLELSTNWNLTFGSPGGTLPPKAFLM